MNFEKSSALRAPIKKGEDVRKFLSDLDLLRRDLKINRDKEHVYFPIKALSENIEYRGMIITKEFERHRKKPTSYQEIAAIPEELRQKLPSSYDMIGDIILIKLSKDFQKYKNEIGESLLRANKNIKTVALIDRVRGEFRTRNVEIIAGEKITKATHAEHRLKFKLDVKKTYFSPRLATERKRVAGLVQPSETIVDMFAGVAPFSIIIAKYANPKIIYAIDKNKDAVEYAKINVKNNNVLDKIEVIHGDAEKILTILDQKNVKADRIIMNLPFSAVIFFEYALKVVADTCKIHYYDIIREAVSYTHLTLPTN